MNNFKLSDAAAVRPPNTKPFDIEAAKNGAPVVTRDGLPAKFLYLYNNSPFFEVTDGHRSYDLKGQWGCRDNYPHEFDLFMLNEDQAPVEQAAMTNEELIWVIDSHQGQRIAAFPDIMPALAYLRMVTNDWLMLETDYIAQNQKPKEPLNPVFVPDGEEIFHLLTQQGSHGFTVDDDGYISCPETGPVFRTREAAEAHSKALNIELMIMSQPGREAAVHGKIQYTIEFDEKEPLVTTCYSSVDLKLNRGQFGIWSSREVGEAALKEVGSENILWLANYRCGIVGV